MQIRVITFSFWTGLIFALSCTRATSTYPSYERAVARARETADAELDAPPCDPKGISCDCPMVTVNNQKMYDCDGRWITWEMGYWVHDPFFYMYDAPGNETPPPREETDRRIITIEK